MSRSLLLVALLFLPFLTFSQNGAGREKYWIYFMDKGNVNLDEANQWLSQRSLDRRERQHIPLDAKDCPVNPAYLNHFQQNGYVVGHPSKWLNALSAWLTVEEYQQVQQLSFVRDIQPIRKVNLDYENAAGLPPTKTDYDPDNTSDQIEMIGLDQLHRNGYNGRGVLISVMDNGFINADENPAFSHLFANDRVVATWDFVNNEADVFDQGQHGAWVLSILAGFFQNEFIGSVPGASFILCHTENDQSETHQEEDNWVAAMEFADSIGADLFTTSLGYSTMDDTLTSYTYANFDGDQAVITIAADIAASRGIIVVNSAGNQGEGKITAPADGDSVIAVGAVDANRDIAGFSSRGPSFDGRIKPDLCAMGSGTNFVTQDGLISSGGGTSFSGPVLAGLAACLFQSEPSATNMEVYQALIQSADRYSLPDTVYGYGIPSAAAAFEILNGYSLSTPNVVHLEDFNLFPNPTSGDFNIHTGELDYEFEARVSIYDATGRKLMFLTQHVYPFYVEQVIHVPITSLGLAHGMYIVEVEDAELDLRLFSGRLIFHK